MESATFLAVADLKIRVLLDLLIQLSVKGGLLLAVAVACLAFLRNHSASVRHVLLSAALGATFALPFLLAFLPDWRIALLPQPAILKADPAGASLLAVILVAAWAGGFAFYSLRLCIAYYGIYRLMRESVPLVDPRWVSDAEAMARGLGIQRDVSLLKSEGGDAAMSAGLFRPLLIIPGRMLNINAGKRRALLTHELAHVKRRDNATNLLAQLVAAFHWFNPLVWWCVNRLRIHREQACDDRVLALGVRPSEYASFLLEASSKKFRLEAVAVSSASALKGRLVAILDPRQRRAGVASWKCTSVLAATALLLVPLASVQVWVFDSLDAGLREGLSGVERQGRLQKQEPRLHSAGLKETPGLETVSAKLGSASGLAFAGNRSVGPAINPPPLNWIPVPQAFPYKRAASLASAGASPEGAFFTSDLQIPMFSGLFAPRSLPSDGTSPVPAEPTESPSDPPPLLQVEQIELETLGGEYSLAKAINNSGQIAGASSLADGSLQAVIWDIHDGVDDIGTPLGWVRSEAVGINDRGEVLIVATDDRKLTRSYLWSPSDGWLDIGTLGGDYTRATALNSHGQVIGISEIGPERIRVFYWSRETGIVNVGGQEAIALNEEGQVLGHSGSFSFLWSLEEGSVRIGEPGVPSRAYALNQAGQVVGQVSAAGGNGTRAFVWTLEGGMVDPWPSREDFAFHVAFEINDAGQALGIASHSSPSEGGLPHDSIGFVWSRETGAQEIDASNFFLPKALNRGGWIAGATIPVATGSRSPAVWSAATGTVQLATHVDHSVESEIVAINDRGEVAGNFFFPEPVHARAVVWVLKHPE